MTERVPMERIRWPEVARELGFDLRSTGSWVDNGAVLDHENGWLVLKLVRQHVRDPLRDLQGRPGLWRALREGDRVRTLFDIPPLVELERDESDGLSTLNKLVQWAESTWWRPLGGGAEPPPREEVESWMPASRRQLRVGAELRQVEIEVEPSRFALSIPCLWRIAADLPEARLAWIEEILHDAQERLRMVRLGIDEEAGCVCGEVDLTGAPPTLARPLLELGLEALVQAARGTLPALAAAADPAVQSQLLDRQPGWARSRRERDSVKNDRKNDRNHAKGEA